MANREIDPRFFLPPNVVDLTYADTSLPSSDVSSEEESEGFQEVTVEPYNQGDDEFTPGGQSPLPTPDSITVVSQTARVTSGGTVVDVVINVEDLAGVSQFEVRLTK